ncbi:hypothetical protein [Prauserella muralis]|uniref:hypothetical protein n=1 Tax=Prauserella muralis TaxID=588067 RepID=UPI0014730801|nr:hypothetical protein [Prauserella muralis]
MRDAQLRLGASELARVLQVEQTEVDVAEDVAVETSHVLRDARPQLVYEARLALAFGIDTR